MDRKFKNTAYLSKEIDVTIPGQASQQKRFYQYALWLAFFTIFYNTLEGLSSVYLGI